MKYLSGSGLSYFWDKIKEYTYSKTEVDKKLGDIESVLSSILGV